LIQLDVFINELRVGVLSYDSATHQFEFDYASEWIAAAEAFPLAPTLPLDRTAQTAQAHSRAVRIFFENLLPEGKALDDTARNYAISKSSVAGLLMVLGRECAGALRIVPQCIGEPSKLKSPPTLRYLPREELSQRIRERASIPFAVWDQKVWGAISGCQDKLAVYQNDAGEWFLADAVHLASTHILKPEPTNPRLAGLTSNEFICLRLAKALGLNVAAVQLHHVPEPVLLITRFDRTVHVNGVCRLPVIDGCQALGLPVGAKYEGPYGNPRAPNAEHTGASLASLFHLLDISARPAAEKIALLRWVVFQVLIGNIDAHAKNLTFFCSACGLSLAPAYDLVSGRMYANDQVEEALAMAIGDAFCLENLSAHEWVNFSRTAKLSPGLVQLELIALSRKSTDSVARVIDEAMSEGADTAVATKIDMQVRTASERLLEMARSTPPVT